MHLLFRDFSRRRWLKLAFSGTVASALVGTCIGANGAPAQAAVTSASFKPAPLFDGVSLKTLPNGVRGLVREARGSGLVCVQVWVRAGGRYESDANSGVSHLLAEAGLRASQNYPSRTEAGGTVSGGPRAALEQLGGDVKTLTSRDATFYSATIAAQYLPQALRALSDAVLRPAINDRALSDVRLELSGDQRRRETDALDGSTDVAYRLAFAKHPYRKPAGGSSLSVEAITTGQAKAFHQAHFTAPSVVVVGDCSKNTAHDLIGKFFYDARPAAAKTSIAPETALPAFKTLSRRYATQNRIVTLGFRSPGMDKPADVLAADVLLSHWKEGSAAKLRALLLGPDSDDENADAKNAPALGFDVDFLTQRDPGLLLVTLVVDAQKSSGGAVDLVLGEIEKLQTQGISESDLARAKKALAQQYLEQSDTVSGQAGALGFYEMIGTYEFATSYLDRVAKVSAADVQRLAKTYLSRTSYVQVISEPTPRARPNTPDAPLEGGSGSITTSIGSRNLNIARRANDSTH